jgi:formate hydrogenlyase subunit 3/multisubunit Na+/H+ antiporter MnhD subunit
MGAPNHYLRRKDSPDAPRGKSQITSQLGTIALVVTLLGLLAASILFAIRSWTSLEGPPMPGVGYVAMAIGVLFSLVIGIALMALLFYSSRHGYDERASGEPWRDDDGEPQ